MGKQVSLKPLRKPRGVKRFTVELEPPEYELLNELAETLGMKKAQIIRLALRHYFGYTVLSLYAPELKELVEMTRLHDKSRSV